MGIRNLSLGVPGFGFSPLYIVKFENLFEIKAMLLKQETLLEMPQYILQHFLSLSGVVWGFVKELLACCGIAGANQRSTSPPPPWAPTWGCSSVLMTPGTVISRQSQLSPALWLLTIAILLSLSPWVFPDPKDAQGCAEQPLALPSPTVSVGGLLP